MYLIFESEQLAKERMMVEAIRRGCDMATTRYWWSIAKKYEDGRVALNVGDGDGLTETELANCVDDYE